MIVCPEELAAKRREVELLRQRRALQESNGLAFYKPHRKQDLFHRAGNYLRRYMRTGNRFGKSDMGASEDCAFAIGERPWYPKDDPARYVGIPKHSTKGCIVVTDWDKASEIFTNPEPGTGQGKLFKKLSDECIHKKKKGRSGTGIVEIQVKSIHGGISTIHLETVRSYMQNKMGLESSDWDWIHVDEPCPKDMWTALSRGLIDRQGKAWFTCTPVEEPWINDYFIPAHMARAEFDEAYINTEKKSPRWVMTGASFDNPYVTKESIEEFAEDIDKDEQACRIYGIPAALSGLVYKQFDHNLHVYGGDRKVSTPHGWVDEQTPPDNYTIRVFIDPHPRTPHAVLYFATSPQGQTFIFNEHFSPGLISQLVEDIKTHTNEYFVETFQIDPIAFIENPVTGTCFADEFYAEGIPVEPAPKDLSYGILKTQQKLRERDDHGNPTLFVHESCTEFLWEVDRYIWKRGEDKPVDKDDHMMENLYRAVLNGLEYQSDISSRRPAKPLRVDDSWRSVAHNKPTSTTLTRPVGGRYLN
jgi:hypothetical protein